MSNTNLNLGTNWDIDEWPDFILVNHEAAIVRGEFGLSRKYVPERTCEGCVIPERDYGHAPYPCFFCARNNNRDDMYEPKVVS